MLEWRPMKPPESLPSGDALLSGNPDLVQSVEKLNFGLIASSVDKTILAANDRVLQWTGYDQSELLGQKTTILAPPDLVGIFEEEGRAIAEGDLRARLLAVRRKDGTTFPVLILPHRFYDTRGNLVGSFSVVIEMGMIFTAKNMVPPDQATTARLQSIALELHSIGLAGEVPGAGRVPLEHSRLAELSPREKEVLTHLVAGQRVPAISKDLFISPHTVRNHLKNMFDKLGVGSQSALIEFVRDLAAERA